MTPTLDVTGFVAASRLLRAEAGMPVVFSVPQAPVWPAGTRINADTGEPYNAMVKRTNAEFTTVTITALVVLKEASPLRPQADAHFAEGGFFTGMDIILDIDDADHATVDDATEFAVNGLNYRVEEFKPFGVGGQLYRWLIYGMER